MSARAGRLVLESVRCWWSRPVWAVTACLAGLVAGAVCALMVAVDASGVQHRQDRLAARGWGLVSVASADGEEFDARACAALADLDGVDAVGAVGETRQVTALGLAAGLSLTVVSVDVVDIVWPEASYDPGAAVVLSPGFVALTGTGAGVLHLDEAGISVPAIGAVLSGDARTPTLDGGVLLLRRDLSGATRCLVDVAGDEVEARALEIAAAAVSYDVVAAPLLSADDASPTPRELVQEHRGRGYPLLAAAFVSVIGAMRLVRSRRDRAVYRLLDVSRADLCLMGLVDYVICLGGPVGSAFATTLLLAEARGVPTERLGLLDLGLLLGSMAVVGAGYAVACASGRNRHQFAPGA